MSLTNNAISQTRILRKSVELSSHPNKSKLLEIIDQEIEVMDTTLRAKEEEIRVQTWESIQQGYKPYAEGNVREWENTKFYLISPLMKKFWSLYFSAEENRSLELSIQERKEKSQRIKATLIRKYGFDPRD